MTVLTKIWFYWLISISDINIKCKSISRHSNGGVPSPPPLGLWRGHVPPASMHGTRLFLQYILYCRITVHYCTVVNCLYCIFCIVPQFTYLYKEIRWIRWIRIKRWYSPHEWNSVIGLTTDASDVFLSESIGVLHYLAQRIWARLSYSAHLSAFSITRSGADTFQRINILQISGHKVTY